MAKLRHPAHIITDTMREYLDIIDGRVDGRVNNRADGQLSQATKDLVALAKVLDDRYSLGKTRND